MNKKYTLLLFAILVMSSSFLINIANPSITHAAINKNEAQRAFDEFQEKCKTKAKYNNNKSKCDSLVNKLKQAPLKCSATVNKERITNYMNQCATKIADMPAAPAPADSPDPAEVTTAKDTCGKGKDRAVELGFNIGCAGKGNPIADMTFAIIRFLTVGVGVVVIGSIMYGALQYIGSRGDPNNTARAIDRIRGSVIALLLFIFTYAILSYVVPGQILR